MKLPHMQTLLRGHVLALLAITLVGCASFAVVQRRSGPILPQDKIVVDLPFDTAKLEPMFRAELTAAGFSVADNAADARYKLSGAYAAMYDVFHYKLLNGRFTITDAKTREVVMMISCGSTGLSGAETGVHKMVEEIVRQNK